MRDMRTVRDGNIIHRKDEYSLYICLEKTHGLKSKLTIEIDFLKNLETA